MGRGAVEGGGAGVCPGGSTERLRLRSRSSPRDEERECCLLVLNLVSSTLPCIRQPIDVGRRRATAGDTAPRAGYCPSPPRAPGPWSWATSSLVNFEPLYPPCCPPFRRPPGANPGARGPPPRPSVPARADPCVASLDRPPAHLPDAIRQRQAGERPRRGRARRSRADGTISGLAVGHCD